MSFKTEVATGVGGGREGEKDRDRHTDTEIDR